MTTVCLIVMGIVVIVQGVYISTLFDTCKDLQRQIDEHDRESQSRLNWVEHMVDKITDKWRDNNG